MKQTLQVLNELCDSRVLSGYAIGGAMAAAFYAEPLLTYDLDIFAALPETDTGFVTLEPIYSELRARGYTDQAECIIIEGVPVQFLPVYNALVEEAVRDARESLYEDVPTRVLHAEHLVAIALQTGRPKDRDRVRLLREQGNIDALFLEGILKRYGLADKWKQWTN